MAESCKNSISIVGNEVAKCGLCRLAPGNEELPQHFFRPVPGPGRKPVHPVLRKEKIDAARARSLANAQKKASRNRKTQMIVRKAARAERATERNIIHATKNSGRSNRDGDHIAGDFVTLDTKLQTTRDNPVVMLIELAKVREDAKRAGNPVGGLVLRNRHGLGIVCFLETDFAKILRRIQ
jgi:hypothetical protein